MSTDTSKATPVEAYSIMVDDFALTFFKSHAGYAEAEDTVVEVYEDAHGETKIQVRSMTKSIEEMDKMVGSIYPEVIKELTGIATKLFPHYKY